MSDGSLIVLFIIGCLAFFAFFAAGAYYLEKHTCESKYSEYSPTFGPFTGCLIVIDGQKIPADNWRVL